jgi:hypothetical protein
MPQITTAESTTVARPLAVLVPLIKDDFTQAEAAGMPYYLKAGQKLLEAREGHFRGNITGFYEWAEKNFKKSQTTIRTYITLKALAPRKSFKSISEFHREEDGLNRGNRMSGRVHREWTVPVDTVAQRAQDEARRLALEESLTRRQEREAERKLALRLIDIGFKVLAKELHPDKVGGSRDAMARLNRVRDRLKECV